MNGPFLRIRPWVGGIVLGALITFFPVSEAGAKGEWRTYDNCEMVPSDSNDGDSFHMKYSRPGYGRRYYVRLYWVDTPETSDSYPDRVNEQAEFWGITVKETLKLGKEATKFTKDFLKDGFVVHSKLQDARGQSERKRVYANVRVGETYLAVALVEAGLARVHGYREIHPEGPRSSNFDHQLKEAEASAKVNKRGVWGLEGAAPATSGPRLTSNSKIRVGHQPEKRGPNLIRNSAPAAPVAPTAPPVSTPTIDPDQVGTLNRPLAVYSLKNKAHVGTLKVGDRLKVLGDADPGMLRIRFRTPSGKVLEAQCRSRDLSLEESHEP
jgi:endonuclease YncB( thermonuclease family)